MNKRIEGLDPELYGTEPIKYLVSEYSANNATDDYDESWCAAAQCGVVCHIESCDVKGVVGETRQQQGGTRAHGHPNLGTSKTKTCMPAC